METEKLRLASQNKLFLISKIIAQGEAYFAVVYFLLWIPRIKHASIIELFYIFFHSSLLLIILSNTKGVSNGFKCFVNLVYAIGIFFVLKEANTVFFK